MSIITKIIEKKKERIAEAKSRLPLPSVRGMAERANEKHELRDFEEAITRFGPKAPLRLIAEMKKASPSKGLIRADFDPSAIARIYDSLADAVSVLTEEDFFQGHLDNLGLARKATKLPLLRKDFIIDEYQIYEARAAGADAVLLIAMALEREQASALMELSYDLGMDVLFEVHDFDDFETAMELEAPILGVNNRDLRNLQCDLKNTLEIMREVPKGVIVVSESGISTRDDVNKLEAAGVDAMLVGSHLMKSADIAAVIRELRS